MKRIVVLIAALTALGVGVTAQTRAAKTLDIYIADTEGGKAALYVSPGGQTVLVDTGNPGPRDGDRIIAMLADAGVKQLDYLIATHYHSDHVGGLQELVKKIPVGTYVDHGATLEAREQVPGFQEAYAQLYGAARHIVAKAGDRLPVAGLDWRIVTSAGQALKTPLPGGGKPNPACAQFEKREEPANPDDNNASVGSVIAYGQFRVIDLADLLWNKEGELMCPNNPVGTVDIYMADNHGSPSAGSPALVHGVRPRVAIMQNGTRKGGSVAAFEVLETSPGIEDIWQLHWAYAGGIEHNSRGMFIANVDDAATIATVLTAPPPAGGRGGGGGGAAAHTPAYYIKVSALSDGTFTVTNTRNQFSKTYRKP
jgi:beta-lactamase superfamily II metal-dependent hydrolase